MQLLPMARIIAAVVLLVAPPLSASAEPAAVIIGFDGEYGVKNSTSAQAIEQGIRTAIAEINQAGGVLGGRPLQLETTDNRSVPARSQFNLRELAARKDLVAVFGGRFSPVIISDLPVIRDLGLVFLDPWGSADGITANDMVPNPVFRLSLKDSYAMPAMVGYAKSKGLRRLGLLVPNTAWGRSNAAAAKVAVDAAGGVELLAPVWYNWGDQSLAEKYLSLIGQGADGLLLVANDIEGSTLVKDLGNLPSDRRRPIICHWGVTGGRFVEESGTALSRLDFTVVQTFSFLKADPSRVAAFMTTYTRLYGAVPTDRISSSAGVAHAYDLTHILARAIDMAGSTDRAAIRDALERVRGYDGLVRRFDQPFSPSSHDALRQTDVFLARYRPDGSLVPEPFGTK